MKLRIMANSIIVIYDKYYQVVAEGDEAVNDLKLNLPGVFILEESALVNGKQERSSLVSELHQMLHQLPLVEDLYKQASQDFEAGYMDYDANSKAYILDHALSSVDAAINMLTPFALYAPAKDLKDKCDLLRKAICKEHPNL